MDPLGTSSSKFEGSLKAQEFLYGARGEGSVEEKTLRIP